jgi:hypothetical protein
MNEIAATNAHFRVFGQSLAKIRIIRRAVEIPYVHEVTASMKKNATGLTPYLVNVFQTMNVATIV